MLEAVCTAYGRVCVSGAGVGVVCVWGGGWCAIGRRGGGNRAECVAGALFLRKSV